MLDFTKGDEEVLKDVLKMFRRAEAYWGSQRREMDESDRFLHNTDGVGQWPAEAIAQLEEEGRPVNTMNLLVNKVQSVVGMCEENREQSVVVGVGDEDRSLADFVNAILRRMNQLTRRDELESESFEHASVRGEHCLAVDVERDPKRPTWLKPLLFSVDATDVAWDPGSKLRDRADARYVFWSKWLSKDDLLAEYPELKADVEELFRSNSTDIMSVTESDIIDLDDYAHRAFSRSFFVNEKTQEVRVVRFECKKPVKRKVVETEDGEFQVVDDELASALEQRRKSNPNLPRLVEVWDEEVRWVEFVRHLVLFNDVAPVPFDGFSIVPQGFYMDSATAQAYGMLRHGKDPQQDVNKSFSQSLDHLASAGKPGWIGEITAVEDKDAFEEAVNTGGSLAVVKPGALVGGAIRERAYAPFNEAVIQRLEVAIKLLDLVTGVVQTAESPSRAAEAATTTALREKRALRAIIKPLRLFQHLQAGITRRFVEIIGRAMTFEQMLWFAGDAERWQVEPTTGALLDTERQTFVDLSSLRDAEINLDFESTPSSDLQRMNELGVLLQVAQLGQLPIEPEILASRLPLSRAEQEAFRKHVQEAAQAQAQAAQQQQQVVTQQIMSEQQRKAFEAQTKAGAAQETARHNAAKEISDFILGMLAILEKAEGTEKTVIMSALKQLKGEVDGTQAQG